MIWITSDQHFSHKNILKFEPESRPFETIEEMNQAMIDRWNSVIAEEDIVFHCGDFFMGTYDTIDEILPQLNGEIYLILGNHDIKNRIEKYKKYGVHIIPSNILWNYEGLFFSFSHELPEDRAANVIYCYGHVHHNAPAGLVDNTYHVGVDTNNLTPISIEKIWSAAMGFDK